MPPVIEASSVTSIANVVTPDSASRVIRSTRRATAYVVKPAPCNLSAVCSPIPLEPPVTSATRSVMGTIIARGSAAPTGSVSPEVVTGSVRVIRGHPAGMGLP